MKTLLVSVFSFMLFLHSNAQIANTCNINFSEFSIGDEHNKRVLELYENVEVKNLEDGLAQIKKNANNLNFSTEGLGVSQADIVKIGTEVSENLAKYNNDIRNWPDAPIKKTAAYPYISQILSEVDNLVNIADFNKKLDIIESQARQGLTCQDLDIVIATIGVTRSSAYLWEPIELGGYGLFEKKFGKIEEGLASRKSLRDLVAGVIVGDASALSASFLAMSAMLAIGLSTPGLNVAILTGLAIDAAIGSACGGFMGWFS